VVERGLHVESEQRVGNQVLEYGSLGTAGSSQGKLSNVHLSTLANGGNAESSGTYQPTIIDLSQGVPRAWPRVGDFAVCIAAFIGQAALTDAYYGLATAIYGGVLASILALLVTRYVRVRPHRLPWIELMFAHHYSLFGLSMLSAPTPLGLLPTVPHRDSFDFGSMLALISGLAMIAGFLVARQGARHFSGEFLLPTLDPDTLARASRFHLVVAAGYVLLNVGMPSIRTVLLPVANIIQMFFYKTPLAVVAVATYLAMPRPLNFLQMLAAFGVLGAVTLTSSMLGDLLVPLLGVIPLWWRATERVPVVLLVVTVTTLIFVQPVKSHYRDIRWDEHSSNIGVIAAWEQAFSEESAESHSAHGRSQTGSEATIARMSELTSLAYVVELVPDSVPHTGGIVYSMLLTSVIPRVFWPDKPNMTRYALNPFVIALGLTTPEDSEHSAIGISLPAQGYFEHGIAGSIGWMALFGVMAGLISRYFGTTLAGTVAGATVMGPLCTSGAAGFQNTFGAAWQQIFGATLLVWLLFLLGAGYRKERVPRPHESMRAHGAA
jgi:hypothetical protein